MNNMEKAKNYMSKYCRKIDYLRLCHLTENRTDEIIEELLKFQNKDGGFGNALEADIRTPSSSAVATESAINILEEVDEIPLSLVKKIISYLENSINKDNYWTISPDDVEEYPHAVWWSKARIEGFGTMNPTATIIGFLYKHKDFTKLDVENMLQSLISEVISMKVENIEEHTLLCLCRLLNYIGEDYHTGFTKKLDETINHVIERDSSKWVDYSPEPIKYIQNPKHRLYKENKAIVDKNIKYLLESQSEQGTWKTKHQWFQYEDVFEATAKTEWEGVFTVDNYKRLIAFGE